MEDEIKNFIKVWLTVFASLAYCYIIPTKIPKGMLRLLSLLPIISIFTLLPLKLTSVHLSGTTGFFIAWLGNFKLLLFAFDQGPLYSTPFVSLPRFISVACLPIKTKAYPSPQITQKASKSSLNYATKVLLLALLIKIYDYKQHIHPTLLLFLYCFHIYFFLDCILAVVATTAQFLLGLELEPPFNEPYLSTSLQDFWGKRWNLMVTSILSPSVYYPVRRLSSRWIGRRWGMVLGVLSTYVVSGLMHEMMFYYLGRMRPTWEVMWFFVLHGVCLALEMSVKKSLEGRWRLHPAVSVPLTCGFVFVTSFWLFFPQFLRCGADVRGLEEYDVVIEFVKGVWGRW